MAPNIKLLFNEDKELDHKLVVDVLTSFGKRIGLPGVDVDGDALGRSLEKMRLCRWSGGMSQASAFKKMAAFTTAFVSERPIVTEFPSEKYGPLSKHQNSIFAYEYSVEALHKSIFQCQFRGMVRLENRITVSRHFWQELMVALSASNLENHWAHVSLIYESLCYENNPTASYKNSMGRAMPDQVV